MNGLPRDTTTLNRPTVYMLFKGAAPALVTPFDDNNQIDEPAFCKLIDRQIAGGSAAVVVLGTTGENATIAPSERTRLVDLAITHVAKRVPVIVGTGNNSTSESIEFSREAAKFGADGLLVVGPYYNKPPQAGFKAHVSAIADATPCPIILYNVPGRTGFNATASTTLELAESIPSVVGVKEASADIAQISDILAGRPSTLAVYSGDDEFTLPLLALGADGIISVVSNVFPRHMSALVNLGLAGQFGEAKEAHFQLLNAMRACFMDTNPIPAKAMLADLGLIKSHVRLPLVLPSRDDKARIDAAIAPLLEASREKAAQLNTDLASVL